MNNNKNAEYWLNYQSNGFKQIRYCIVSEDGLHSSHQKKEDAVNEIEKDGLDCYDNSLTDEG